MKYVHFVFYFDKVVAEKRLPITLLQHQLVIVVVTPVVAVDYLQYLVEEGVGRRLSDAVEVVDVDELEVVEEAGVGDAELRVHLDVRQVAQLLVTPVVQVTDAVERTRRIG